MHIPPCISMPLYQTHSSTNRIPMGTRVVDQFRDAVFDAGAPWDQYVQCAAVEDPTQQPRVLRVLKQFCTFGLTRDDTIMRRRVRRRRS